ncbi:protein flp [Alistipes sp.]|jgi:CubicO group peptidase (beta-lactamase class C family)|nr:protein flp [Alistipes sp.]
MRKLRLSAAALALSAAIWFLTPLRAGRNDSDPIGPQAADAAPVRIERVAPESVGFDPVRLGRVDEAVGRAIDDGRTPGAVVCVVRHGRVALLRAYGNRRTVPDTVAMSEDTIFDLASLTKVAATTVAVMQLVEQGRLRLGDRVDRYINGFEGWRNPDNVRDTTHVRIVDLLTHTSGLPAYVAPAKLAAQYPDRSLPDAAVAEDYAAHCPRLAEPGTEYRYSCLNFIVLQRIVERMTGEVLDIYARDNIFRPLGMSDTGFLPDGRLARRCAPTTVSGGGELCGRVHDPLAREVCGGVSGNAGLFSTAEDLAVFAAMLLSGGEWRGVRVLSPLAVEAMSHAPRGYERFGRTLGWDTWRGYTGTSGDLLSESSYYHTGATGTSIVIDPELDLAVIILTNRVHPSDGGSVARLRSEVANAVAGALVEP